MIHNLSWAITSKESIKNIMCVGKNFTNLIQGSRASGTHCTDAGVPTDEVPLELLLEVPGLQGVSGKNGRT